MVWAQVDADVTQTVAILAKDRSLRVDRAVGKRSDRPNGVTHRL